MLYVLKTGYQWRMLPKDFPPWKTVYGYLRRWRLDGTWDVAMRALCEAARRKAGRNAGPSMAIIDSRSVKSASKGGSAVSTQARKPRGASSISLSIRSGFILTVVVHSAGIQDRTGARAVLIRLFGIITYLQKIYVDGSYAGKLIAWAHGMFGWVVEVVKRNESGKFVVLPKRWIVERTFAWLTNCRRLNRDYEINPQQFEAMIKLAMIRLLAK